MANVVDTGVLVAVPDRSADTPPMPAPASIPELSLGAAAVVIAGGCAALAAARGLARLLLGTGMFAASVLAGFWMWQHGPALVRGWVNPPPPGLTASAAAATAVLSFLLLRRLLRTLADPLGHGQRPGPPRRPGTIRRALAALASLLPAALLCFVAAALVRHAGTISELKTFAEAPAATTTTHPAPTYLTRLKYAIESAIPPAWFHRIDPLADDARLALAKWIVARPGTPPDDPPRDPASGQPVPRALIVEHPDLLDLARRGRYADILRDPRLDAAIRGPASRRAAANPRP